MSVIIMKIYELFGYLEQFPGNCRLIGNNLISENMREHHLPIPAHLLYKGL